MTDTAWAPPDGTFVWFVWGYHRYYRLPTLPIAQHKLNLVVARHLCWHEGVTTSLGIDGQFSGAAGPCWPREAAEAFLLQPRASVC